MTNLKEIRTKKKLTQQEVAKALNVSHATYWGYETGKYEPNIEVLKSLSKIFDVSIDYIVGNENNNVIDLSFYHPVKQDLLLDIIKLEDYECYEIHQALLQKMEFEISSPEIAEYKALQKQAKEKAIAGLMKAKTKETK